ncbi:Z1 domain-containing protein [Lentzea waywayandensis]|uniref:Z1 domain-containing protein n=1 Tax=Lentzea waywayandensis TaxID=84724 RepID=A0A1I6E294_9PSEU|nr:Z1 domain-containing protein [Lentzea waywayandensis]
METLVEDGNNPYDVHHELWKWGPKVDGPNFARFLEAANLPEPAIEGLRRFTPKVLGQSSPPEIDGISTGLVIGKVQSGKTNSFLALSALASDNGYRMVIVLSGTKNILKDQTYRQVVSKLSRGDRSWMVFNFEPGTGELDFENALRTAFSPFAPRTLVVTILKRTRDNSDASEGIDRLATLLERSDLREKLAHQPTLIIDDEADEASLDNSAKARSSGKEAEPTPTFKAILRLKEFFCRQAFVQYTATPQANLLAELTEQLSPDYCELLPPGDGYCGAADFFPENGPYWQEIPQSDVDAVADRSSEPPESLVEAMRYFFVSAALEEMTGDGTPKSRSMLVHPERQMPSHNLAEAWVQKVRSRLREYVTAALDRPDSHLAHEFYAEVAQSLQTLSTTTLVEGVRPQDLMLPLHHRLGDAKVRVINSKNQFGEDVDWNEPCCWIFVGGDVLQRGFAFQGLTTTWMARGPGTGQVDVLMQRGRFFGYRKPFFKYCRIWLPRVVHDDYYALFAEHEAALWRAVQAHIDSGKPMTEWPRVFRIDPGLRLCRRTSQWIRLKTTTNEWLAQRVVPSVDQAADAAANAKLVQDLRESVANWQEGWVPSDRNAVRMHRFAYVQLKRLEDFLTNYRFFGQDDVLDVILLDVVASLAEQNDQACAVVVDMRPDGRNRRAVTKGEVNQLFQGANKLEDPAARAHYPGDRAFRAGGDGLPHLSDNLLTIQLHEPNLDQNGKFLTDLGGYLSKGCPLLGAWLPEDLRNYRRQS